MGSESAETLMNLLPPVGWADVATNHDLSALEQRLDLRFDAVVQRMVAMEQGLVGVRGEIAGVRDEINTMTWRIFAMILTLVPALVVPLVTLR